MVDVPDDSQGIQIFVAAQGLGSITNVTASPNPALYNELVNVTDYFQNTGASDYFYIKHYVNQTQNGSTIYTGQIAGGGTTWTQPWSFTMPNQAANITVVIGHMIGPNHNIEATPADDTDNSLTVGLYVLPEAAFTGTVTYSPGQTVDPGTPVTISYSIINTGGTGTIVTGLYDTPDFTGNLLGTYQQFDNVGNNQTIPVTQEITTGSTDFAGYLVIGHWED